MTNLMRFIPKEYKGEVKSIRTGVKEFDEITRHWATTVVVTWADGSQNEYPNKTFMFKKLREFGR